MAEAETARKRAHTRAVQQDEARRRAERVVGPLEQLVRRLGGDPAEAEALRTQSTEVDDRLLADDWHDDLEEAPQELRDALAQELAVAPQDAPSDEYDDGHTVRTELDSAPQSAPRRSPTDAAKAMAAYPTDQGLQALGALLSEPAAGAEKPDPEPVAPAQEENKDG